MIEEYEGIVLDAYLDPVGVPTICAGLTRYFDGSPVRIGDVCSEGVCRGLLELQIKDTLLPGLESIPGWNRFGEIRQAVLVCFAWNWGGNFYNKSGFEEISKILRKGVRRPEFYRKMPEVISLYSKIDGRSMYGLRMRRKLEGESWQREDDGLMSFAAREDTCLKRAAIQDDYLSDNGKQPIKKGETITVTRFEELPADSHAWITLQGSGQEWAIYVPDWSWESATQPEPKKCEIDWHDFGAMVSEFVSVGEILQYDSRRISSISGEVEQALVELCNEFDELRKAWGTSICILSGFRPEPYNTELGGQQGSYHTKGMALDLYPLDDEIDDFHDWLIQRWSGGFGDGRNQGFIHIDIRKHGRFLSRTGTRPAAVWSY